METRFLQTLLTVVETGSLAQTARRLAITPSAVIQRVKALEDEIGQPLICRAGHAMRPTAAGTAVLADIQRLLAAESDVKASASAKLGMGLLRVGVIQPVLTGWLPDTLIALKKNRPGIEIYLSLCCSAELYADVQKGELDMALLVKPPFPIPKTLDWMALQRDKLVLLAPRTVKGDDPLRLVREQPFIRFDRNQWTGRIVDQYLRKLRLRPSEQFELDSLEAIATLVDRGLGVSLVPDWPQSWPRDVRPRKLALDGAPDCEVGVIWPRNSNRLPLIRLLLNEVQAAMPPRPSPANMSSTAKRKKPAPAA